MSLPFRSFVLTVLNACYATAAKLTLRVQTLAAALRFTSQRTVTKTLLFTSETYPYLWLWIIVCIALISLLPGTAFGADISLHGFFRGIIPSAQEQILMEVISNGQRKGFN